MISRGFWYAVLIGFLVSTATGQDQPPAAEGVRFFESKIRPALVTHCYECHSTESGKARGGLKVDSRDALLRGGDSGSAVVAKSLEESVLYQALLYHDDGWQMPPKGKLPQATIDDFRRWILMGAPDPRITEVSPDVASVMDIEAGRQFWAYQPLSKAPPPATGAAHWSRTAIDQFIEVRLKEQGLRPVGDASPEVLVRRLYFVLTGLPPSPEDLRKWVSSLHVESDTARQAVVAQLVDELLASDRYGERWGRHWLDVARFAESTGGDHNNVYQHAWRYRDHVIDAFNNDKPFDQFIREQIAGDLLPIANDEEWASNIIATGFLAVGVKSVGEEDQQKFFADMSMSRSTRPRGRFRQLASTYGAQNDAIDPDNQFCWRMNQRRLEAEAVRDAMLAVSGRLVLERPLGTYLREAGEGGVGQNVFEPVIRAIDADTRSVYLPRVRSVLPEMLETFDSPDASLVTGNRDTTSSPLRSLFLMSNQFVQDQAVALAERVAEVPQDQQVDRVYELAFGRSPTKTERQLATEFLGKLKGEQTVDRRTSGPPGRFGGGAAGDDSGGMRRGRFSRRFGAPTEQPNIDESEASPMSPLAIYCQALLSSMEFQMID